MSFWTAERHQLLIDLAPLMSESQIAERLGCSRNAVIGRVHRCSIGLGLPRTATLVVAKPKAPKPDSIKMIAKIDETRLGHYRCVSEGYFEVRCFKCEEVSQPMFWGKRASEIAPTVLRQHGYTMLGNRRNTKWTCAKCCGREISSAAIVRKIVKPIATSATYVPGPGKSIVDLGDFDCRWLLGDPSDLTYCGQPKADRQYCAHHAGLAYRPKAAA